MLEFFKINIGIGKRLTFNSLDIFMINFPQDNSIKIVIEIDSC